MDYGGGGTAVAYPRCSAKFVKIARIENILASIVVVNNPPQSPPDAGGPQAAVNFFRGKAVLQVGRYSHAEVEDAVPVPAQ